MKIAVSSKGKSTKDQVDARFEKCRCFILINPSDFDDMTILENPSEQNGDDGAAAGKMIADAGADAVITGALAPDAFEYLKSRNVKVYLGALESHTVRQAILEYHGKVM